MRIDDQQAERRAGRPVASRAFSGFAASFGRAPDVVWSAPGRVNLIGEHTDYNEGLVLPFAITQRTAVAAALRPGGAGATAVRLVIANGRTRPSRSEEHTPEL